MSIARKRREEAEYQRDQKSLARGGDYCSAEGCLNIVPKNNLKGKICDACWRKKN